MLGIFLLQSLPTARVAVHLPAGRLQGFSGGREIGLNCTLLLFLKSRTIRHVLNDPAPLLDGILGNWLESMTRRAARREQAPTGYQFFK